MTKFEWQKRYKEFCKMTKLCFQFRLPTSFIPSQNFLTFKFEEFQWNNFVFFPLNYSFALFFLFFFNYGVHFGFEKHIFAWKQVIIIHGGKSSKTITKTFSCSGQIRRNRLLFIQQNDFISKILSKDPFFS